MTDPYGRKLFPEPPKKPKRFSVLRPLKLILWLWVTITRVMFSNDEWRYGSLPLVPIIFFHVPWAFMSLWLGWWGFVFPVVTILVHLYLYFALHLDDKEKFEYWVDRFDIKSESK